MTEFPASTVYQLKRAELAVRNCVEAVLRDMELTPNQLLVLALLERGEASSAAELARSMGIQPQSVTELIGPLQRNGMISRKPDAANKRVLRIRVTAAGKRLFLKATEAAMRMEQELLANFNATDLQSLNRSLDYLVTHAEAHSCYSKPRRRPASAA